MGIRVTKGMQLCKSVKKRKKARTPVRRTRAYVSLTAKKCAHVFASMCKFVKVRRNAHQCEAVRTSVYKYESVTIGVNKSQKPARN